MQFDQFPYSFKQNLDTLTNQKINQVNQQKNDAVYRLNKFKDNAVHSLSSSKNNSEPEYGTFAGGGFVTGLVVGAFVCFTNGDAIDAKINFSSSIGSALMFWLLFGIVGAVIGLILCGLLAAAQNGSNNSIDNQIASQKRSTDQKIEMENQKCNEIIKRIREDANAQYVAYLNGFNAEAQKMSVRFAESPLAVEVIDWMTNGFANTINSADRRSHVQEIKIPFVFKIYRNKIECNLGTYDFEIKRCDELETPLEQTALARAIASAIQLNITMKYPQDVSGTKIVTDISYDYYNNHVSATIIYTATNGNYKKTRGWAVEQ